MSQQIQYVIDSSIFIKLLHTESDSDKIEQFLNDIIENDIKIAIPTICLYEIIGSTKQYGISFKEIKDFLFILKQISLVVIDLDEELIEKAFEITSKGSNKSGYPTFYDCVYHALAIRNKCFFITADKRHEAKVKSLGHIKLLSQI